MTKAQSLVVTSLAALAFSGAQPAFAGSTEVLNGATVARVAVSAASNTVQIFLTVPSGGVLMGECDPAHPTAISSKVAVRLDSAAAEAVHDIALSAELNERLVNVVYDNTAAACTAGLPRLTFLRMAD